MNIFVHSETRIAIFKSIDYNILITEGWRWRYMQILIAHYSLLGHTNRLAEAVVEGARQVEGSQVMLMRIPDIAGLEGMGHKSLGEFRKSFEKLPVCSPDDVAGADALILGAPTYLGNMCAQMQQFLNSLGKLWREGSLVGKVGSAFTSSGSQHGGQEAALLSIYTAMLHLGMIVIGLPYTFQGQMRIDEITGGTPYGATTIVGQKGERWPSENELAAARFQGRHVASLAAKLAKS
jgi:NAD(P)H dehydrogenase (quinone)